MKEKDGKKKFLNVFVKLWSILFDMYCINLDTCGPEFAAMN